MKEQSSEIKRSKKKISSMEKQAKLDFEVVEKAKLELTTAVRERDTSYATVIEARGEVIAIQGHLEEVEKVACSPVFEWVYNRGIDRANDNNDKQLAKLCPGIFQEDCLACLKELDALPNIFLGVRLLSQVSQWTPLKPILPLCCPISIKKRYWRVRLTRF